jgi:hypothetical protein
VPQDTKRGEADGNVTFISLTLYTEVIFRGLFLSVSSFKQIEFEDKYTIKRK